MPAIQELKACLEMAVFALSKVEVNSSILSDPRYDYLFSVERLNQLVMDGIPFRDAYKQVGKEINEKTYKPFKEIEHVHQGSIGNLCLGEIRSKMEEAMSG